MQTILAQAGDPGVEAVGGILMFGLCIIGVIVAIAWIIMPFIITSKANRMISLLQSQYELQFRDAQQQAAIEIKLQAVIAQLERISGEPAPPDKLEE